MTLLKGLLIPVVAFGGFVAVMYAVQRSLLYHPDRLRTAPAAAGLAGADEIVLDTADGEKVIVWHVPPKPGRPLLLYFHGNAGTLAYRAERFRTLTADGTGLVALSYRGYGGSTGRPTEAGLMLDAEAAYGFARSQHPDARLVVFGESLGTGVAVAMAGRHPAAAVILESPYTSIADVAAAIYWFLPVRLLLKDGFYSDRAIAGIAAPLLILHGARDAVVPIAFSERLFALAAEPKRFVRFPEAGHADLDRHGAMPAVRAFLADVLP
jgi:fermentation-respiration switch protein FrsA (DUF1100 family)